MDPVAIGHGTSIMPEISGKEKKYGFQKGYTPTAPDDIEVQ